MRASGDNSVVGVRNMPGPEAYTPFENFTLVHSLYSSGTSDVPFFTQLSNSMKSNTFITKDDSYDPSRLEPDSLKDLYIHLLQEEAKRGDHAVEKPRNDPGGQDNPRKRKLSSPSTSSFQDGSLRMDLLLPLIDRLYLAYKNDTIKVIQDEERKYRLLNQEIQEINRGEWDTRFQHQETAAKKDNRGSSSLQTILRHDSDVGKTGRDDTTTPATKSPQLQPNPPPISIPGPILTQGLHQDQTFEPKEILSKGDEELKPIGSGISDQLPQAEAGLHSSQAQEPAPRDSPGPHRPETPPTVVRKDSNARSQPLPQQETTLPHLPPPQPPNPAYSSSLPNSDASNRRLPYLPTQPQTISAPLPSPRLNQPNMTPQERSSQSPIILPPPPGMLRSSGAPPGPLDALADMAGQQFRPKPSLPSSRTAPHNTSQPHPIQLPQPRNLPPPVYPYPENQQPYSLPYPQYGQNQIPNYYRPGNSSGSIYQGPTSHTGRPGVYGNVPIYQSPPVSYSQYPPYPYNPSYYQTPVQPQYTRTQASRFVDGRAPVSTPPPKYNPPKPPPINTSVIATKWKKLDLPGPVGNPGSPTRPGPEEISPISARAPSPILESPDHQENLPKTPRSKNTRGSYLRGQRGKRSTARAGSVASSSVTGSMQPRTRSHSVLSHADELSMDNNASSNTRIKPEPPATPVVDEDTEMTETTADEGSGKPARHRREKMRGFELGSGRAGIQRKRDDARQSHLFRSGLSSTPHKNSNFILGSRNFPRTSATIMNDISAHKLASMFAKPLTEREAPGYKDLIYRPQDLKSIKSAIIAGSKALVAAADSVGAGPTSSSAQMGSGTPNSKGASTVWVPATADVMPPKGIVNSAQLEKELMRMFANAVMFNRDPKRGVGPSFRGSQRSGRGRSRVDSGNTRSAAKREEETEEQDTDADEDEEEDEGGVVRDTREMFEAVEKSVADWRAAERTAEDLVIGGRRAVEREDDGMADELAGDDDRLEESTTGNKRKRR